MPDGIEVPGGIGIVTLGPEPDVGGINPLIEMGQSHLRHAAPPQHNPQ